MAIYQILLLSVFLVTPGPDDGFIALVPAGSAQAFERVKLSEESVVFTDGEIRLTGSSRGYLATKAVYGDFVLRFEWRFEVPKAGDPTRFEGNSGVLLRIKPPHKVWPCCLEYQIHPDDPASLFAIDGAFDGETNAEAQRLATRQLSHWNESEIEMIGKNVVSRLNGQVVAQGTYDGLPGPLGIQSQGGAIRFRKLRIKPITQP